MQKTINILMIDDSTSCRIVYRNFLTNSRENNYHISEANSPQEALEFCKSNQPDCVLVDYQMPDIDGISLMQRLQKNASLAYVSYIMITGFGDESVAVKALKCGAHDYLIKDTISALTLEKAIINAIEKSDLKRDVALSRQKLLKYNDNLESIVKKRTIELEEVNQLLDNKNKQLLQEIGEREKVQSKLHDRNNELAHASRLCIIGQMASELAHEINQPLSSIRIYSDFIINKMTSDLTNDKDITTATSGISKQSELAENIVKRIMKFAKKATPKQIEINVNALIAEAISLSSLEGERHGITIHQQLDDNIPPVWGDPIQITQVILNLLRNSFDAISNNDQGCNEIFIRNKTFSNHFVEISVQDSGKGFTPESLARAFDSFFTTKKEGLGIGLSISRSIIEAHNGKLWIDTNCKSGTIIRFKLPIKISDYTNNSET